jgi:polysaccharide deacetylase 2 family uncharacterized protein YibQ
MECTVSRQKRTYNSKTLIFMIIAILLVVVLDRIFDPLRSYESTQESTPVIEESSVTSPIEYGFAPPHDLSTDMIIDLSSEEVAAPQPQAAWQQHAVSSDPNDTRPRIVIIIDDMGMNRKHSRDVMELPGPMTLAFLPYADDLAEQTRLAREKGHELMVHVPMEPMKDSLDSGPNTLRVDMTQEAFDAALQANLSAFDHFVGINNHMGSRMTQDRASMDRVMRVLKEKGYLFVDSRTINTSIADKAAEDSGVPYAVRDVFIDHEETYEFAEGALEELERQAKRKGYAIAIGHPKPNTISALKAWLPTLEEKGLSLVPVSAIINQDQ